MSAAGTCNKKSKQHQTAAAAAAAAAAAYLAFAGRLPCQAFGVEEERVGVGPSDVAPFDGVFAKVDQGAVGREDEFGEDVARVVVVRLAS
jgi:hypothetical protein